MPYYVLISLVFIAQLSAPVKAGDVSNLEVYLDQNNVLETKISPEEQEPLSVQPPHKISASLGIATSAKSAIVVDQASGAVLFQKEPDLQLPIASITKLMTALVFLNNNPGFEQAAAVGPGENDLEGARLYVKDNEEVRLIDLFFASLVGSANNATQAMVHSTGMSGEEFVVKMNQKAQELEMNNSHFVEPTGLNSGDISTVTDLVKLARAAFSIPEIQRATTQKEHSLITVTNQELHTIKSPDELLNSYLNLTGAKTGFTYEADYCLVARAKNEQGHEVIAVVLGSESNTARFQETKALISWAFKNYQWE